jgi:peptide/nickel transport system substrate-binding protein
MKLIKPALILTLFIFSSCSHKQSTEKIFRYNEPNGIESLDPITANNYPAINALINIYEGLVEYNKDAKLQPLLAKSYEISEDGKTYTFHLRTNVYFQDNECFPGGRGRKLTAGDFKYCYERVCNPNVKTRGLWVYRDKVSGADEYSVNPDKAKEIKGFIVINDSTFQIRLNEPFAPFISILTMPYGYVYPKEAVEYYKQDFGFHAVGTGPYKFVRWDIDKELVCEKNKNYWGKDSLGNALPYIDGFRVSFIRSAETEFLDFEERRLDFEKPTIDVYAQLIDENGNLKPQHNYDLIRQPYLNTVYLAAMQDTAMEGGKNNPLSLNTKLRQALNYAIDREKIVKYVLKGKGTPGIHGPLPKGMPGYTDEVQSYAYDRDKAVKLLAEAGYPGGKGLHLKLVFHNDESQRELCEAIQAQFKELGIDLTIEEMLGAAHRSAQNEGKLQFWRANWGADYYDPENYYALFYSKNHTPTGPNTTCYENHNVDSLYELALRLTDFDQRMKVYRQIDKIINDDAAWIVVYYNQFIYLKQNNITGMYVDGLGIINLKYCSMN